MLSKNAPPALPQIKLRGMEYEIGSNPVQGSNTAKIVLIEFADYQCPYYSRYVKDTYPLVSEHHIDKGIIQYAVIDTPLPIHNMAAKAAESSKCANE